MITVTHLDMHDVTSELDLKITWHSTYFHLKSDKEHGLS
jgi:hypothetical protein